MFNVVFQLCAQVEAVIPFLRNRAVEENLFCRVTRFFVLHLARDFASARW